VNAAGRVRGPSGKILKAQPAGKGYPSIQVWQGKDRRVYVHTLVCTTFHGPRPTPEHEVAHWDGDKDNNAASNLRWATPAENQADSVRHGTKFRPPGAGAAEANGNHRLTWDLVRKIRADRSDGLTLHQLAAKYGVGKSQVHNIVTGKQWRQEWKP
jgi:hypothetical protein